MNIKNLIKSQKVRHKIMSLASCVPDWIMLPLQYKILLHRWPNLKEPQRFTEWIQFYKINYRNPVLLKCVDKYAVRKYITDKIGDVFLAKLFQVCSNAHSIEFEKLPNQFVIKTTSGGNGDNVIIVKDKTSINKDKIINSVNSWLSKNYSNTAREWAYSTAASHPLIITEEYLENDSESGLDDYKFLCYNGKFRYLWVDHARYTGHRRGFWNQNLDFLSNIKSDHPTFEKEPQLPTNISEMIKIAEKLAADFPFVRVDLYNIKGRIVFGELTFYPWSGYVQFDPDNFDYKLGKYFPKKIEPIWTKYTNAGK